MPSYIDEEGYEGVLKTLEKVLDFFEDELGRDDRQGRWLGGWLYCGSTGPSVLAAVHRQRRLRREHSIPPADNSRA